MLTDVVEEVRQRWQVMVAAQRAREQCAARKLRKTLSVHQVVGSTLAVQNRELGLVCSAPLVLMTCPVKELMGVA